MRHPRDRRGLGVRTRLLIPLLGLAVLATAGLGAAGERATRQVADTLVEQRGATVLAQWTELLEEHRRTNEVYALLLAGDPDVVAALGGGDQVALAQVLVPLQAQLGLGAVDVHGPYGAVLLHLGEEDAANHRDLLHQAMVGITGSATQVTEAGLVIDTATPVKGPPGIIGTLIVGNVLDGEQLGMSAERDRVELAVYRGDRLVGTSGVDWLPQVRQPGAGREASVAVQQGGLRFQAVSRPLGEDGTVTALVPVTDLVEAAGRRSRNLLFTTLALIAALVFLGLGLVQRIIRPLRGMVAAANRLADRDYGSRIAASGIRELDDLGGAVNHLAGEVEARIAELVHQAGHDLLTGLPNRALFAQRVGEALADHRAGHVAVLLMDLDDFKTVNDSLGHAAGDELLVGVAQRLAELLGPHDLAARLGGDEFAVLLAAAARREHAAEVAEQILQVLRPPFTVGAREVGLVASIGIAHADGDDREADVLLRNADVAMYLAKGKGKARSEVFSPALHAEVVERLELKDDLRRALERREFEVQYQPIVDLATERIIGAEALVRWQHPTRGMVPPLMFVPLAEETGLIVPLGRWVLDEACREARRWQRSCGGDFRMSVNLSVRQLHHPQLVDDVRGALRTSGIPPVTLVLEITESVFVADLDAITRRLAELKALGVRLAIDDFGTGYSSLSYLQRLPVDVLKIDRAFVQAMGVGDGSALIGSIIAMAEALRVRTVAEGIEERAQLDELRSLRCDLGQGYLFARPLTVEAMDALLDQPVALTSHGPAGSRRLAVSGPPGRGRDVPA